MVLYSLVAILGATVDLGLLWNIAETFNGLMAIPNLIAVFLLSGVVVKLVKEYFTTGMMERCLTFYIKIYFSFFHFVQNVQCISCFIPYTSTVTSKLNENQGGNYHDKKQFF